jgi:hypothetical protein
MTDSMIRQRISQIRRERIYFRIILALGAIGWSLYFAAKLGVL